MMKRGRVTVLFCVCLIIVTFFSGWGFLVHRTINQLAIYKLPKGLQPFFYSSKIYLVKNSVLPDERRNKDQSEAPKHFIDAEAYGDSALWKMPADWSKAVARYTKDTLYKYGYVPYWVMVIKTRLTVAFKRKDKDSILFYAADLGHYIGDAHVPLHTSLNYDGQLTGQKGLHSLWESTIPELEINQYQLYNIHKAKYLKHPEAVIWKAVRQSFSMVEGMLQEERNVSNAFKDSTKYRIQIRNGREVKNYSTAFARAYAKRLGKTINQQLLKSADMISDFWYTCWVDAGKPDLSSLSKPLTEKEKEAWENEKKFYKKNTLLKNNLLIARQTKDASSD